MWLEGCVLLRFDECRALVGDMARVAFRRYSQRVGAVVVRFRVIWVFQPPISMKLINLKFNVVLEVASQCYSMRRVVEPRFSSWRCFNFAIR